MFIAVSGTIGVGKTTFAENYQKLHPEYKLIRETVEEHPFLEKYYKAIKNKEDLNKRIDNDECTNVWEVRCTYERLSTQAFYTQMFFLTDRHHKHFEARALGENVIADRTIYEDMVFATMLADTGYLDRTAYERIYVPHFMTLTGLLYPPNLLVYLDATIEDIQFRQTHRGREMEKALPIEYNKKLRKYYDKWIASYPHKKIWINTTGVSAEDLVRGLSF